MHRRRDQANRSTRAWEPAYSGGRLSGCWSIDFPSNDGLASIIAGAGAATSHTRDSLSGHGQLY